MMNTEKDLGQILLLRNSDLHLIEVHEAMGQS
jgi:hypothetical protein